MKFTEEQSVVKGYHEPNHSLRDTVKNLCRFAQTIDGDRVFCTAWGEHGIWLSISRDCLKCTKVMMK